MLQDVGGYGDSEAWAVNASGWSVGYSCVFNGGCGISTFGVGSNEEEEAVLWSPSGVGTDLGAVLGSAWSNTVAVGLNDRGDIIGYGDYLGEQYGFLLTPVPEPSTWMMMLAGFAGLGLAGYPRARKGNAATV